MNVPEFRAKYPQYDGLSDDTLTKRFHQKYYPDMEYEEFANKINYVPEAVRPALQEALDPPSMGYEGLRGTSTIATPQPVDTPLDKLTREFKEAEAAPVSPYSQALTRGAKNVKNAAIDTLGMLPEGDEQKRYEYLKRTGHPQAEKYNPVNKVDIATKKSQLDPVYNPGEGLTKYAHDFVEMIPQIAGQIGTTLATGPAGGGAFMATQIAGPQYDSLVKQGVPKNRARIAALLNAAGQGALEQVGMVKALKSTNGGQVLGAMFTEWLTETMQKNPELATNIWATTEGKSNQERMEMFTSQWVDAMKEGAYEGLVAAPFGGLAATASSVTAGQQQPTGQIEPTREQNEQDFQHDDLETARVTPEQSLEVPSEVKPVVVGTKAEIKKLKDEGKTEGKQIFQTQDKAYVIDPDATHAMLGEETKAKSLTLAKKMLREGDDSRLLGKPEREGVPQEELVTTAVTREGDVLTEPDQIKEQVEAGKVIEAAEGRKEEATAQAEKVSEAVKEDSRTKLHNQLIEQYGQEKADEMIKVVADIGTVQKTPKAVETVPEKDQKQIDSILETFKPYNIKFDGKGKGDQGLYSFTPNLPEGNPYRGMSFAFDKVPTQKQFEKKFNEMAAKRGLAPFRNFTPKQLARKVKVEAIREKTGETITVEVKAKDAFAEIDSRRNKLSKLMDCLTQ